MSSTSHSHGDHANGLGFLLTLAGPALLALSATVGRTTGHLDLIAFLPLAVAFGVVPALAISGLNWAEPSPVDAASSPARLYFRLLPAGIVPVQIAALAIAVDYWSDRSLDMTGRIGWVLSTGIFSALFAINVAHELIHRRSRVDRVLGGILLSTACFGTFKIVHVRVHHRFVCTDRDFSSARRGDSIYGYWLRNLAGNPREALRCERARLRQSRLSMWKSELAVWYMLSVVWFALAVTLWGWTGGAFFLLQSLVAILTLDLTNYVQHYGLRRKVDANGRYEPVGAGHAWSMQCRISNLALLNLLRHGDHHTRPLEPYHRLRHTPAPAYPYPFAAMILLALCPPLFRRVVDPLLEQSTVDTTPLGGS